LICIGRENVIPTDIHAYSVSNNVELCALRAVEGMFTWELGDCDCSEVFPKFGDGVVSRRGLDRQSDACIGFADDIGCEPEKKYVRVEKGFVAGSKSSPTVACRTFVGITDFGIGASGFLSNSFDILPLGFEYHLPLFDLADDADVFLVEPSAATSRSRSLRTFRETFRSCERQRPMRSTTEVDCRLSVNPSCPVIPAGRRRTRRIRLHVEQKNLLT
jgi:hypothetical protein